MNKLIAILILLYVVFAFLAFIYGMIRLHKIEKKIRENKQKWYKDRGIPFEE